MPPAAAPAQLRAAHGPAHDHSHEQGHSHEHAHGEVHQHSHAHHHAPGHRHPAAKPAPSLLRLSAWQRLGIVLPLAGLLWAATLWVIQGGAS